MFQNFPTTYAQAQDWTWADFQPFADDLLGRGVDAAWLGDYSSLADMLIEVGYRAEVAHTQNTADPEAERRYNTYLDHLLPRILAFTDAANRQLAASGFTPPNFDVPLRRIQTTLEIYRDANLPLLTEQGKLSMTFDKIMGAQTFEWDGQEIPVAQVRAILLEPDRATREKAWRLASQRQLQDRAALNDLWVKLFTLRGQIAANAGEPDYRAYIWKEKARLDYTPQDCQTFRDAIEAVFVPAAARIYEKKRQKLGVERLRPWDLSVDLAGKLIPYQSISEFQDKMAQIYHRLDPQLGGYFDRLRHEGLLDLENRKNKAPGGYCTEFPVSRTPFIFMNAVGSHDDVQTLLHEAGHAFHAFEAFQLPYTHQRDYPTEFAEVASMAMELIGAPHLTIYYTEAEAARARLSHLEDMLTFLPYMAVVDGFQHWAYTHPEQGKDPAQCDAAWDDLWARFMVGVDWTGLDADRITGWHRKLHIFQVPFYYVEYGMAQIGAVQVWARSLQDPRAALADYRAALALGGTRGIPGLFAAAGARFAFDVPTLQECATLIENTIAELEAQAG